MSRQERAEDSTRAPGRMAGHATGATSVDRSPTLLGVVWPPVARRCAVPPLSRRARNTSPGVCPARSSETTGASVQ